MSNPVRAAIRAARTPPKEQPYEPNSNRCTIHCIHVATGQLLSTCDRLTADLKDVEKLCDAFGEDLNTVEALEQVNDISEITDSWLQMFHKWNIIFEAIPQLAEDFTTLRQAFEAQYITTGDLADVPDTQRTQTEALRERIEAIDNINCLKKHHHEKVSETMSQLYNRLLDVMKRHAADAPDAKGK